ncbi:MAG: helix-turn-helix transcriptional regulator [Clostridiaceae bacterium]|nr:helix-turn-helix transcriptional regulator [Clostridiaceae bacterium]
MTQSEKEVLYWLVQGLTNEEIAQKRGCTDNCIKLQVKAIMRKLNAKNRAHLAYIAGINHFVELILSENIIKI